MSLATLTFWSMPAAPVGRQPTAANAQSVTTKTNVKTLTLILRLQDNFLSRVIGIIFYFQSIAASLQGAIFSLFKKIAPLRFNLYIEELHLEGVVAYEVASLLDVLAHKDTEQAVGFAGVVELDVQKRPAGRIHRRFPELLGVHLAKAFEPLSLDALTAYFPDA